MEVGSSCCISKGERSFLKMLKEGAVLVGDRWFPADSQELERARYLVAYHRRLARNERRRERRRAERGSAEPRRVRAPIPMDVGSQRTHRLTLERRKCLRRSTVAECPTPAELRAAWAFRHATPSGTLRLGGLLLDLECYVDSSLRTVMKESLPKIIGRRPGIRGWIRENCPELDAKYKSLMRAKALAKSVRQELGVPDPVPTAVLLDPSADPAALADGPLHVQPRGADRTDACELVRDRFVWERSEVKLDANGRPYRDDENYWRVAHGADYCRRAAKAIAAARDRLMSIILNGKGRCTIENYVRDAQRGLRLRSVAPRTLRGRGFASAGGHVRERRAWELIRDGILAWIDLPYALTHAHRMDRRELAGEW